MRIEDTDSTRFVPGAEEYINESLAWLGVAVDEGVAEGGVFGPYKQSERREIYQRYAMQLIETGWGYYAFDTPEELDALRARAEANKETFAYDLNTRMQLNNSLTLSAAEVAQRLESGEPWVIRFKMPEGVEVQTNDMVRGSVSFQTNTLDDKVLYKSSDRLPTYHLANIVDDHLMEITHVIRGEEWLPSVPLHIMLYRAFGWESTMPRFAHLPLILKPSGKGKLSKRDGDKEGFPVFPLQWTSPEGEMVSGYRESGYFPEAVLNLLALLGWNPGTEQELFTVEELVALFSIERVNKSGARFDPEKARWFNHQYLQLKSNTGLAQLLAEELVHKGIEAPMEYHQKVVELVKERVNFVAEMWDQAAFFYQAPQSYDDKVVQKRWKESTPAFMEALADSLHANPAEWEAESIKAFTSTQIELAGANFGNILNAFRLVLVGGSFGPDLFVIAQTLGRAETVARIKLAVERLGRG